MCLRRLALLLASAPTARAHGRMSCPAPRQMRDHTIDGDAWTRWVGMTGGSYAPGFGNSQSLNSGGLNPAHASPHSRDLCGGTLANGFNAGARYGPTDPRGTFVSGGLMVVTIELTAHHRGALPTSTPSAPIAHVCCTHAAHPPRRLVRVPARSLGRSRQERPHHAGATQRACARDRPLHDRLRASDGLSGSESVSPVPLQRRTQRPIRRRTHRNVSSRIVLQWRWRVHPTRRQP